MTMDPLYYKVPRHDEESIRVEIWNQPKFYEPFHYHEECQLTLILASTGTVFMGSSMVEYDEGDLFFMGENLPHVLRNDRIRHSGNETGVRAISVFFSMKAVTALFEDVPEAREVKKLMDNSAFGLRFRRAARHRIGSLMKSIGDSHGLSRFIHLLQIINYFAAFPDVERLADTRPVQMDPTHHKNLTKVFDFVMSHYNEKITLETVSSLIYMTPTAFCRYFKRHTQKSFSSFLIEVRVNKACKMLQEETSNVSDSCYSSGYNNKSNFHRHFLRVMGVTPNEYKKMISPG
ncbi:MAG: AraC family transcriptional regulator [Bacteroidetes bacterium]|nr:MAG: AraC family transcriptional regulator [Bacteroidota bacterium]